MTDPNLPLKNQYPFNELLDDEEPGCADVILFLVFLLIGIWLLIHLK